MNFLLQKIAHFSPAKATKVWIALVFSLTASIFYVPPACAERHIGHGFGGRHEDYGHRDLFNDRFDYQYHRGYGYGPGPGYGYQPLYRQPYIYAEPVYVPPPIYYQPPQSPGINLFFPLDMRHR
ncbi:MAG: hypothetical protein ACXWE9_13335 [Methylobacter sp.]